MKKDCRIINSFLENFIPRAKTCILRTGNYFVNRPRFVTAMLPFTLETLPRL